MYGINKITKAFNAISGINKLAQNQMQANSWQETPCNYISCMINAGMNPIWFIQSIAQNRQIKNTYAKNTIGINIVWKFTGSEQNFDEKFTVRKKTS